MAEGYFEGLAAQTLQRSVLSGHAEATPPPARLWWVRVLAPKLAMGYALIAMVATLGIQAWPAASHASHASSLSALPRAAVLEYLQTNPPATEDLANHLGGTHIAPAIADSAALEYLAEPSQPILFD